METYFSIVFKTTRQRLGCSESDFARLLEVDESEIYLIENYQLFPEADTLFKLDQLTSIDEGMVSLMY